MRRVRLVHQVNPHHIPLGAEELCNLLAHEIEHGTLAETARSHGREVRQRHVKVAGSMRRQI